MVIRISYARLKPQLSSLFGSCFAIKINGPRWMVLKTLPFLRPNSSGHYPPVHPSGLPGCIDFFPGSSRAGRGVHFSLRRRGRDSILWCRYFIAARFTLVAFSPVKIAGREKNVLRFRGTLGVYGSSGRGRYVKNFARTKCC